ncbi:bile acid:sodium symporter family protein [Reinekea sp.]|jgi:BASS family bile acid:Na+ symporter|uniref:bile acid:sodium symporter family protein n=1 Tax=Reinekea sp. TaxID=1970455 RepID=UPI003988BCB9
MIDSIENVQIAFNPASLIALNGILALMMFGVSLSLTTNDFVRIAKNPIAPIVGLVAQFILLPALTTLLVWWWDIHPQLALGMILVASCPGGTFSNLMTYLAKGNVAVSVSMTAVSSLAATVMTPFNFFFYGNLNPHTSDLITEIAISPMSVFLLTFLVLGVPLILGMLVGSKFPNFKTKSERPFRILSLVVLLAFSAIAFGSNMEVFLTYMASFAGLVMLHNALALLIGGGAARLVRLNRPDRKAVTLEVGIQNSAMGLSILFTFFPEYGGMLVITAFWGVWHLISGLALSFYWSKTSHRDFPSAKEKTL